MNSEQCLPTAGGFAAYAKPLMAVSPAGLTAMRKAARRWLVIPPGFPAIDAISLLCADDGISAKRRRVWRAVLGIRRIQCE